MLLVFMILCCFDAAMIANLDPAKSHFVFVRWGTFSGKAQEEMTTNNVGVDVFCRTLSAILCMCFFW